MDDTCLEDSLMQPADQTQSETAAVSAEAQGDGADIPNPSGALGALVKVQNTCFLVVSVSIYFVLIRGKVFISSNVMII